MREALVSGRTQLANSVRGWLRQRGRRVRSGAVESLAKRVRAAFAEGELPGFVERQLRAFEGLNEAVCEADLELEQLAHEDPLCRRLQTVPGVGPVTAVRFVAALDQVKRFTDAHQVESYIGLVPGERSSSDQQHRLSITKAGAPALRRTLVQAAWAARMTRTPHPMVMWSRAVELRRGKHIAAVALARKIAGILYAMWRDGTTYDPRRGAATAMPEMVAVTETQHA
jgi:transposase